MPSILVIGSSNTDMVVKSIRFPQPGETILGGEFYMFPGGKGANQAVAAARLGGDVIFIYKTGNDIFGKQATDNFKNEDINIEYSSVDNTAASGIAVITVNDEGENEIIVASGANNRLSVEDIEKTSSAFHTSVMVLLQLEIPIKTVEYAVAKAKGLNKKVILNPAPAQQLSVEVMSGIYLITPNETEAELLSGIKVTDEMDASYAANKLLQQGVQHVIITLGSKGAFYKSNTESFLTKARIVKAIDTTAAGDVFNGAIAVALAENKNWREAIEFACKAASLSVTRMGAQASAPYRKEIK